MLIEAGKKYAQRNSFTRTTHCSHIAFKAMYPQRFHTCSPIHLAVFVIGTRILRRSCCSPLCSARLSNILCPRQPARAFRQSADLLAKGKDSGRNKVKSCYVYPQCISHLSQPAFLIGWSKSGKGLLIDTSQSRLPPTRALVQPARKPTGLETPCCGYCGHGITL